MTKSKGSPVEIGEGDGISSISCNHRRIVILIRGKVDVLCNMIACAPDNSAGARQILNKAMALFALRKRMQGKGPKAGNRNKLT